MDDSKGALQGIRVLDLTWVYAGPFATRQFADMGAEVIKIEPCEVGALERRYALVMERNGVKQSSYSVFLNRGKKSLSLDLKSEKGGEIIRELARRSDVMISNMAPGAMNELGLGYDAICEINPGVIYCTISCFGHQGPYAGEPGFDLIAQAASGWCGQSDPPMPAPVAIGDANAGMHAVAAILAALYYREKTGRGQSIDLSMTDCLFHTHENSPPAFLFSNRTVPARPNSRWYAAYSPYALIKGRNGLLAVAALSDALWERVVAAMGEDYEWLLTHPRTCELTLRLSYENAPFVHQTIEDWVMRLDSVEEAERRLRAAGVPAMVVRGFEEVADAPYLRERGMVVKAYQPFVGEIETYGSPFKMSRTPGEVRGHGPLLGENCREVLTTVLGYEEEQVDSLFEQGVIYKEPAVDRLAEEEGRG